MNLPNSEEEIVSFVNGRFTASEENRYRKRFMDNFDMLRRAYNGEFKNKLPKHMNQFFVRLVFSTVDSMMAYFYQTLFRNYPLAKFSGRESNDMLKGKAMQYAMDYEIYFRNFIMRNLQSLNWVLKYGMSVTHTYWRYEVKNVPTRTRQEVYPGLGMYEDVTKDVPRIESDDPDFLIIDPRRFFPDPCAGPVQSQNGFAFDMKYAGHENMSDFCTIDTNRDLLGWFNLDKIFKDSSWESNDVLSNGVTKNDGGDLKDQARKRVRERHYWGTLDIRKNYTSDLNYIPGSYDSSTYHVTVANENHLMGFEKNPYYHQEIPYEVGNIYLSDDSIYGQSVTEAILPEQDILNILVNLRLDNIHNLVNPSPIVWTGGLENKDHFEKRIPGEAMKVKFPDDLNRIISFPAMPDVGGQAYTGMVSQMKEMATENSAANPINMGVNPKTTRSATEISYVSNAATARFQKLSFVYANTWTQPILRRYVKLIQQFTTTEKNIKVMGERPEAYVKYTPEEVQGEYDIEVMDASVGTKELISQAYANMAASLAPYFQSGQLDVVPFLEGILENNPLIKDADKMIRRALSLSPEEIAVVQQLAPQVMAQIEAMRAQKQGLVGQPPQQANQPQTTPGSGFNGGAQSMGPQMGTPNNAVRVGM